MLSGEEKRSKNMKAIKSKDTKIEKLLRKSLWEKGYRYRKNYSKLPGKPDIAFTREKIAVFCDSEFWHGKDWNRDNCRIKNHREFWINKIERNIARDKKVNETLSSQGWTVLRFWGKDIEKNCENCTNRIINEIISKK